MSVTLVVLLRDTLTVGVGEVRPEAEFLLEAVPLGVMEIMAATGEPLAPWLRDLRGEGVMVRLTVAEPVVVVEREKLPELQCVGVAVVERHREGVGVEEALGRALVAVWDTVAVEVGEGRVVLDTVCDMLREGVAEELAQRVGVAGTLALRWGVRLALLADWLGLLEKDCDTVPQVLAVLVREGVTVGERDLEALGELEALLH